MDIKQKILDHAPTKKTRVAIVLLILSEGTVFSLVPIINPITLELDQKNLSWLSICLALFLALAFSLFVNFHLANRLKKISDWVNEHEWVKSDNNKRLT